MEHFEKKVLRLQNNSLSLNSIPESLLADSCVSTLMLEGNMFEMKVISLYICIVLTDLIPKNTWINNVY